MIDIEKIKKLIKLANKNPNEHEANSAARMVCRLLADYNFELKTAAAKVGVASSPFRRDADWVKKERHEANYSAYDDLFNSFFRNRYAYNQEYREGSWKSDPFTVPNTTPPPRPEKRVRKCGMCGKEVETKRVTAIFNCDKCEWESYLKKEGSFNECPKCKSAMHHNLIDATYICIECHHKISEVEFQLARGAKS